MPETKASHQARILIGDDREDIRRALSLLLRGHGYHCEQASSPRQILQTLSEKAFDLLLLDMNYTRDITSGREGLDILPRVVAQDPHLPIVVMTAWATVNLAVETLKRGAKDFIEKPWDNQRLLRIVENQVALGRALSRERVWLREQQQRLAEVSRRMIAKSKAMKPVLDLIQRIGPTDVNVLITGENGTGKSMVAQALHAHSQRADRVMVTVNAGAISDALFESELFGHVKGAFTDAKQNRQGRFKTADGGTLFLDEIGNISLPLQAKLLRVIESGEFEVVGSSRTEYADVRVLSATNADLPGMVSAGNFREDLLYRLNTIEIPLPPLRERREDILPLAHFFLTRHAAKYRKPGLCFDRAGEQVLLDHPWPGNVRELDHAVLRGVLMAHEKRIKASDLNLASAHGGRVHGSTFPYEEKTLEEVENHLIRKALKRFNGNVTETARHLGLGRSSLYRRLEKYPHLQE